MQLHIIETGEPPTPLKGQFEAYPAMIERVLAPLAPNFSFSTTPVFRGAALPPLAAFDAIIITGSPAGVYEGHDWITPTEDFLRRAITAAKPTVGICFGHQLLAQAFGGKVEKSDRGWGVGIHQYELRSSAAWMDPMLSRVSCVVSHQDQVIVPPDGATIIGGCEFCPNGIIEYAQGPAISFQQHPEFSGEFAAALMRLRKDRIPADRISASLDSLAQKSDRSLIAGWIAKFLTQHTR